MENIVIETGGRPYFNEDFVAIQAQILVFEQFIGSLAKGKSNFVVLSGFEITGYVISPGIAAMLIDGDGEYKIVSFGGFTFPEANSYLCFHPVVNIHTVEYETGELRNVRVSYELSCSLEPTGNADEVRFLVGTSVFKRISDIIQNSPTQQFTSLVEKTNWNSKAEGTHTHGATQIIESTAKRFVSDTEKATWNAARAGAVSDVRGGVASTYDTLLKLYNWVVTQLSGKANTSHTHAATDIAESTAKRFVSDSEKATWNAARAGAVSDVQGGVAVTYNTLLKVLNYTNQQLATKVNGSNSGIDWQTMQNPQDPLRTLMLRRDAFGYVYLYGGIKATSTYNGFSLFDGFVPLVTRYFKVYGT